MSEIPAKWEWLPALVPGQYSFLDPYVVGWGTIGASAAATILKERNRGNRPLSVRQGKRYGQFMQRQLWQLNGETIVFDSEGDLRQGQTRMAGCRESGCAFQSFVVAGVASSAFRTYDQHRKRSLADVLSIMGKANPRILAAGVAGLHRFLKVGDLGPRGGGNPALEDLLDTFHLHPELERSAVAVAKLERVATLLRGQGNVCVAHYLFGQSDENRAARADLADRLFEGLSTMSLPDEPRWSGARLLAKMLLGEAASKKAEKAPDRVVMGRLVLAWNALVRGQHVKSLRFEADDPFPEVEGLLYCDGLPVAYREGT